VSRILRVSGRLSIAAAIIVCKLASAARPPDDTPPSAPGNLVATAVSGSQINLSWTPAIDQHQIIRYYIARCTGASCSNYASVTFVTSLGYADTGLASSTTYGYVVWAEDSWLNEGPGAFASATTPDTIAPSPTSGLGATAASGTQINLTWSAASDNVGVAGYAIERCQGAGCSNFAQIATSASISYNSTGLTPATSYSFRVRAYDAASNYGGYSATASATTPDTVAPSPPTGLTASAASGTQINLGWTAASDNVGVAGYAIERCQGAGCANFAQIATSASTSYNSTGLTPAISYSFRVRAYDAASNYGGYSSTASATTPDTVAPLTPSGTTATAISGTQINVSWTASTDNVGVTGYALERCQGSSCTDFAQIATPTTTSHNDTGLTNATTYWYRVRARDAVPNYSSYSSIASATTPDTAAPSPPGTLTATAASATQINLGWTASSDNVGVTGYLIERCQGSACTDFAQLATPTATSHNDTGLTNATTYRYRVRARDAIPNYSAYSSIVSATTPDNQAPTVPTSVTATASAAMQIDLGWTASTDNVAVTGYLVESCQGSTCTDFTQIATPTANSYSNSGLAPGTAYRYRVRASDTVPNYSGYSTIVSATTSSDAQAPTTPGGLTAIPASSTQVNLAWTASTDNVAVTGYLVERCQGAGCTTFAQIATPTTISFDDTGLAPSTTYRYRVRARDAVPNFSAYSTIASAATPADTQAPTTPGTPTATAASSSQINLSWAASTDNVAVTGYLVERCQGSECSSFTQIATPTATSFNDTGLAPATMYTYRVRARDAVPNHSAYSATFFATTPADTQAPTEPAGLTGTPISATQIDLSWTASTDNVAVTGYQVERCQGSGCSNFTQIATPTPASFSDTGLTTTTTYRYRVRARDAIPNFSGYSSIVTVTTLDNIPPTPPTGLSVTAGPNQLTLSWNASTDNVGVTAYLIERCWSVACSYAEIASVSTTTYTDTGVSAATDYSYRVRARDAANNRSAYSSSSSAMPADCD